MLERIALRSELIYRGYSPETQIVYIREVERFLDWINKEVVDIVKSDLVRYLKEERLTKDVNTVLVQLNALEFFFRKLLGINTADEIDCFKREFKVRRLPSREEIKELLGRVPARERLVIQLIKETGFTVKELVELKVLELNQIDERFFLKGKELSIDTARELYDYIERKNCGVLIFAYHSSTIQKTIKHYSLKYLNHEYTERDIKYSFGLEIIKKQGEKKGAEYLGYSSLKDMKQYFKRVYFNPCFCFNLCF